MNRCLRLILKVFRETGDMIKTMTKEEYASYRHDYYVRHAEERKSKQKEYYEKHKEEIRAKANLRYRRKCGL